VHAVRGNRDERAVRELLPATLEVELEGLRVGLVHDAGSRDGRHGRLRRRFAGCDVVAYGHSHLPEVERSAGVWILNRAARPSGGGHRRGR
jgi:predicted phosphodiesterase